MEDTRYHVLLEGRRLGPYDRRTIVGMRMKKALASANVLESTAGAKLTVGELVRGPAPEAPPPEPAWATVPSGGGSYSVIQATHQADLLEVHGQGYAIPPFRGELEVRVQTRVLRLAGRFRDGLAWKEDRVKFPLHDIIHARLQGSVVELGVRPPEGEGLQRVRLDLRTPEAAGELVEGLPHTVPWPGSEPLAAPSHARSQRGRRSVPWGALAAGGALLGAIGAWLLAQAR